MTKNIFRAIVVLPITTVLLLYFSASAYAKEEPLFIYEKEILEQLKERQISPTDPIEQIRSYRYLEEKTNIVNNLYLKELFEKNNASNLKTEAIENILQLRRNPTPQNTYTIQLKTLDDYISEREENYPKHEKVDMIFAILNYTEEKPRDKKIITRELIVTLFEKLNKKEDLRYDNLLAGSEYYNIKEEPIIKEQDSLVTVQETKREDVKTDTGDKRTSNSTNVTLSLTILPVRFVYLKNNEIVEIWNNTTKNDTEYVLKFLDYESKEEIEKTESLTLAYFKAIQGIDVFEHGVIFEKSTVTIVENSNSLGVQFNYTSNGIEEIHTFI